MDIRTLCLGVLTMGDASGYEIKKTFEDQLSHFFEASFGSIYPALNRLTQEGLVTCTAQAQDKRPDKKVYAITPAGRLAFLDELAKPPGRDRLRSEFLAVMMFADLLPARHLAAVIDAKVKSFERQIQDLEACTLESETAGRRFVRGYGIALMTAAIGYIEDNRHLVEGEALLARAAAGD